MPYSPLFGWELLREADDGYFDGNGNILDGSLHSSEIREALGQRNLVLFPFLRGDATGNARVDIGDPIRMFSRLFLGSGGEDTCPDASDADDNGELDISDGIFVLNHLFLGGPALPSPYPGCGWDVDRSDSLPCWESTCLEFAPVAPGD